MIVIIIIIFIALIISLLKDGGDGSEVSVSDDIRPGRGVDSPSFFEDDEEDLSTDGRTVEEIVKDERRKAKNKAEQNKIKDCSEVNEKPGLNLLKKKSLLDRKDNRYKNSNTNIPLYVKHKLTNDLYYKIYTKDNIDIITNEEAYKIKEYADISKHDISVKLVGPQKCVPIKFIPSEEMFCVSRIEESNILIINSRNKKLENIIQSSQKDIPNDIADKREFGCIFYKEKIENEIPEEISIVKSIGDDIRARVIDKDTEKTLKFGKEVKAEKSDVLNVEEPNIDRDKRLKKCIERIKSLSKELEIKRTYEPDRDAIKVRENKNSRGKIKPTVSLDLHGFKRKNGKYALREFLDLVESNHIMKFSIIYGRSKGRMFEITKEILSNREIYGLYMDTFFYCKDGTKATKFTKYDIYLPSEIIVFGVNISYHVNLKLSDEGGTIDKSCRFLPSATNS